MRTSEPSLAAAVLDQLPHAVVVFRAGEIIMKNAAAAALPLHELTAPPAAAGAAAPETAVRLGGRAFACTTTRAALPDGDALLMVLRDRSAYLAREAELTRLAHRDGLTGLLNRRAFDARLHEEAERLAARGRPLGLVLIDLDHFKRVNDEHGHPAGDQVLAEAARRIESVARTADSVGRLGGEEFGWLLPDATEADLLAAVARLRARFTGTPFQAGGQRLRLTASLGFCDLATVGGADQLVARADEALYLAKSCGRDMALGWSPDVAARVAAVTDPRADRDDAFERLAAASDSDDPEHGARVANLAVAMAADLDWTPDRQARLHGAARLHDVGKLALPSTLLGRPGPLSADEALHVGQHARIGAALAARVLDPEQETWIAAHHVRWDDTAAPPPDGAALVAVADAWDAMTNDRVYRRRMTRAAALAELERGASRGQWRPDAPDLVRRALEWWDAAEPVAV
jgi:diguanylate cyclase (GGDEF)-like protein